MIIEAHHDGTGAETNLIEGFHSWLTMERALYGVILLAGLSLRLAILGCWPLLEGESHTALAAWRTLHGSTWRPAQYVPLLYDADLLLFWATRASDAAARLLPALVGAGLALVPYYARGILGRVAALVTSLLLAFAPCWVYFSRTGDGSILTAAASALTLLSIYRYLDSRNPRELRMGAVALGLGLTAGPGIYTTIVAALAFWLIWWLIERRTDRVGALIRGAATRENLALLLGTFLLFGSGFLANPGGIGASVELAGWWVRDLGVRSTALPWLARFRSLLTYEFLTVALAVLAGVRRLRRRALVDVYLIAWAGLALVLGTALGHREPTWTLDALLPLVLLAGRGFQWLWDTLAGGPTRTEGIIIALALVFFTFGFLELANYTHTGQEQFLWYARIAWAGLLLAWVAYWVWSDSGSALRVGGGVILALMVIATVRAATYLAYHTGRDPREPILHRPTSMQMRDLEAMLPSLSSRRAGDSHALDIAYERSLDPWLGWYLRDYPNARAVPSVVAQPEAMVLISRRKAKEEWPVGYVGQVFRLRETWDGHGISSRDRLRWLFYRDPVGEVEAEEMQIWVRVPTEG